jgi:site-specific DNA-methyltransferase (adenine-specific)
MEKSEQCSGLRNKRDVWTVSPQPFPEAHFATFPEDLIKPCILAGCPEGGTVLDPFMGSGTTALVEQNNHCKAIGVELNADYIEIAAKRLSQEVLNFG